MFDFLTYDFIDTGAFYRCAALSLVLNKMDSDSFENETVYEYIKKCKIDFVDCKIYLNNDEVSQEIDNERIASLASGIGKVKIIRDILTFKIISSVNSLKDQNKRKGCVVVGRDVGSVIFPHANNKFYFRADKVVRANRLYQKTNKNNLLFDEVLREIVRRDEQDQNRAVSPLLIPQNAIVIDTTAINISGTVKFITEIICCLFCDKYFKEDLVTESKFFYGVLDQYPVCVGHSLIISKRHIHTFFEFSDDEIIDFYSIIKEMKIIIENKYHPDGFNVGINDGKDAGQTIFHSHIHLIPRYKNDVKNPVGGVRNVIKTKGKYVNNIFKRE